MLTLEATISKVVRSGHMEMFDVPEWHHGMPMRPLYVASTFWKWVDGCDALHVIPTKGSRRSIWEQIELHLAELRCAERPPGADELRRLTPTRSGIWKLHPPGARLYGWFAKPHTLILVGGATEKETKLNKSRNASEMKNVSAFIAKHDFKAHIVRGDYRAVYPR